MPDAELAIITAGIVAAVRRRYPALDGAWVFAAVLIVAAVLVMPAALTAADVVPTLQRALLVAVQAVAGVSVAGYVAGKAAPK